MLEGEDENTEITSLPLIEQVNSYNIKCSEEQIAFLRKQEELRQKRALMKRRFTDR